MSVPGNIIRLEIDTADPYPTNIVNRINGRTPQLPRGRDIILQLGVYERGIWQANPSDLVLITAEVKLASDRTAAATLVENTGAIANCESGEWESNTNQHASIIFPAAQTIGLATANSTSYWLVLTATKTGGKPVTLAAGLCEGVNDGGDYNATVPAPADPDYYTKAQVEARLAGVAGKVIEENGFRGYWGIGVNGEPKWRRLQ